MRKLAAVTLVTLALAPAAEACSDSAFVRSSKGASELAITSLDLVDLRAYKVANDGMRGARDWVRYAPEPCSAVLRQMRTLQLSALNDYVQATAAASRRDVNRANRLMARAARKLRSADALLRRAIR